MKYCANAKLKMKWKKTIQFLRNYALTSHIWTLLSVARNDHVMGYTTNSLCCMTFCV